MNSEFLSAPINICLAITNQCNLNCKHCYVSNTRRLKDLTTSELLDIISQIKELKVFDVNIFGGEPFLRKDFFIILEALSKLKIGISINTNATLITPAVARRLARYRVKSYIVGLDGSSAAMHDPVRGQGSFEKALKGIGNLITEGHPVKLLTTITRFNYRDLENITLLAKKLGAEKILFSKLMHMGNAAKHRCLYLEPEERMELVKRLMSLKSRYPQLVSGSVFADCYETKTPGRYPRAKFPLKVLACVAATFKCAIRPDGWVTPCEILWEAKAGNLKKKRLVDVWRNSPVMRQFRKPAYVCEKEMPLCKGCEQLNTCYPAIRCRSYYYPGSGTFYCRKP